MARKKSTPETVAKGIRFPEALAERIEEMAAREHRDFSKQVVHLLYKMLGEEERLGTDTAESEPVHSSLLAPPTFVGRNGVVREYDIALGGGSEDAQDPRRQAK